MAVNQIKRDLRSYHCKPLWPSSSWNRACRQYLSREFSQCLVSHHHGSEPNFLFKQIQPGEKWNSFHYRRCFPGCKIHKWGQESSGKLRKWWQTHTSETNDYYRFHLWIVFSPGLANVLMKRQYNALSICNGRPWDWGHEQKRWQKYAARLFKMLCGDGQIAFSDSPWGIVTGMPFHVGSDSCQPWRKKKMSLRSVKIKSPMPRFSIVAPFWSACWKCSLGESGQG